MVLLTMWYLSTFYTVFAVTLFHLLTFVVDNLRELPTKWNFLPTLHLLQARSAESSVCPSHREVEGKCQKGQRGLFKPQHNLLPQP